MSMHEELTIMMMGVKIMMVMNLESLNENENGNVKKGEHSRKD